MKAFLEEANKVQSHDPLPPAVSSPTPNAVRMCSKAVLARLEGYYVMEKSPAMEGRFMSMVLSPKASIIKKTAESAESSEAPLAPPVSLTASSPSVQAAPAVPQAPKAPAAPETPGEA